MLFRSGVCSHPRRSTEPFKLLPAGTCTCLAAGTPYSVGPVYILASKAQSGSDPSEKDFWGAGGGKPFATLAYDDCSSQHSAGEGFLQHKYYNDTGPVDRARPCRYCLARHMCPPGSTATSRLKPGLGPAGHSAFALSYANVGDCMTHQLQQDIPHLERLPMGSLLTGELADGLGAGAALIYPLAWIRGCGCSRWAGNMATAALL